MPPLLGCIADDITGATDVALMLGKHGMPVTQIIGVPADGDPVPDTAAVVVALKSRTMPVSTAVADSLTACRWMQAAGVSQVLFKYCSTFDSTDAGNIGPVADALATRMDADITIVCPAFPENGRTVVHGHLFVNGRLLSESGMESHPLTPMTDPDLVRVLGRQLSDPSQVDLVPLASIEKGADAVSECLAGLSSQGVRFAVTDALNEMHLRTLAHSVSAAPLVTGGAGIAMGLPGNFRRRGLLGRITGLVNIPADAGPAVVLAGSCSRTTRNQVNKMAMQCPHRELDPLSLAEHPGYTDEILSWVEEHLDASPLLIYSTSAPEHVEMVQQALGREAAGEMVEQAMAVIAGAVMAMGVSKLIVAGGETSGAVLTALNIRRLGIGPEIEPGVPWTVDLDRGWRLALKSGNFGSERFFEKALEMVT